VGWFLLFLFGAAAIYLGCHGDAWDRGGRLDIAISAFVFYPGALLCAIAAYRMPSNIVAWIAKGLALLGWSFLLFGMILVYGGYTFLAFAIGLIACVTLTVGTAGYWVVQLIRNVPSTGESAVAPSPTAGGQ
jgi:hypothetical protein